MSISTLRKKIYFLGILISVVYLAVLIFTLKDYGLTPDSPFHFMRGQALYRKLTTGKDFFERSLSFPSPVLFNPGERVSSNDMRVNAFESSDALIRKIDNDESKPTIQQQFIDYEKSAGRRTFFRSNTWAGTYFIHDEGPGHPPISDILSSVTNIIFYEKLGIMGDIESYHLYAALTAALTVFIIFYFTYRLWGLLAGFLASVSIALFPFLFTAAHYNIKDVPELAFFAGSVVTFYFWVVSRKKKWFILFMFSFFLAVSTKFNILFLPFILIPWLYSIRKSEVFKKWFTKNLIKYFMIFVIFEVFFFILLWPWLWEDTFRRLISLVGYYKEVGYVENTANLPFWQKIELTGIITIFTKFPLSTIFFMFFSIPHLFKKEIKQNHNAFLLVFLWFLVPILRISLPGSSIYPLVRQYAEIVAPLSIISILGLLFFSKLLSRVFKIRRNITLCLLSIFYIGNLLWITISYYPNQNAFFNPLIGGTKGAINAGIFLSWPYQGSFESPYRQGITWLNEHAEKNAKLAFIDGSMTAISPILLRPDIRIGSYFSAAEQKGEYVMLIYKKITYSDLAYLYLDKFINPVYEVKVKGATLLKVWKNDPKYFKAKFREKIKKQ